MCFCEDSGASQELAEPDLEQKPKAYADVLFLSVGEQQSLASLKALQVA